MKFEEIKNEKELIKYLDNVNDRLKNRKYIYHYTTLDKCIKIINSKLWFLSNAECMNDQLEFNNGDPLRWKKVFFASFMSDVDESIGMWSMYSQPWHDGVQIAIPVSIAKEWMKSISEIEVISCVNYRPTGRVISTNGSNRVFLSSVAYTNCDNDAGEEQRITWSTAKNTNILNASHIAALTGYIKDSAWDYEKEIRIKAEIDDESNIRKTAIKVPNYVFDDMVITASPLFEGDLKERLKTKVDGTFKTDKSIFTGRIIISSACDDCSLRRKT